MNKIIKPNYKKIYTDLLKLKFPEKEKECFQLLKKNDFTELDVIEIENIIFGKQNPKSELNNRRHRSYNRAAIFKILDYQKENNLNNSQLAIHFGLSRNTIAKCKKIFF